MVTLFRPTVTNGRTGEDGHLFEVTPSQITQALQVAKTQSPLVPHGQPAVLILGYLQQFHSARPTMKQWTLLCGAPLVARL